MSKIVQAIKQLFRSKTSDSLVKLVGTDRFENKYYERLPGTIAFILPNLLFFLVGHRYYNSTRRFYEPTDYSNVRLHIDPAWDGK